jgi:hypothetical protein
MKRIHWLAYGVGIGFLILYSITAAPSLVTFFDDSLEFQLVGPTFGIAHPSGYPLYIILGGLWSRLLFPIGNWAWRMNLFSALTGAAAVGLVCQVAMTLVKPKALLLAPWSGLAAALTFGLGPIWWSQATIAEVYTLHALFVAAILLVTLQIDPLKGDERRPNRPIFWLCALIGLALTHHRTTLLLLPAVAIYLLWRIPGLWRPQRAWLGWLLALILPLLLYGFIPLRATMGIRDLHGSYTNDWSGFWTHILARQYGGFFAENPLAVVRTPLDWVQLWRAQSSTVALALGLVGLANLVQARRLAPDWMMILLVLVINLGFAVNYRVHDAEVFLLPALLAFALFIGGGVALIGRWLGRWPRLAQAAAAICVLIVALGLGGREAGINRSQDWAAHDLAVTMAKVNFPPDSHVIGLEGEMTALRYMQQAEGLGQDATPVVADDPAQRRALIDQLVAQGTPLFLTRELAGLGPVYSFTGEGPLVRVWPRGQAQTGEPAHPQALDFAAGALRLEGYDLVWLDQAGGPAIQVAFYWRPVAPLSQTLKVSLRLQTDDGAPVHWPDGQAVQEDLFPLRLVAATPDWVPGERIRDVYTLAIPRQAAAGPVRLTAVVYDAETLAEAGVWSVELNRN